MRFLKKIPAIVFPILMIAISTFLIGAGLGYLSNILTDSSKLPPYLTNVLGEKSYGMPLETFTLPQSVKRPKIGERAPDFVLISTSGKKIRLSDFRGKVVVLDFTATWCGMSREEHNNFAKVNKKYKDRVIFITIDSYSYDTLEDLMRYKRNQGLQWTFVLDNKLEVAKLYGVRQTLSTFVIDKKGIVRYFDNWITEVEELDSIIKELI